MFPTEHLPRCAADFAGGMAAVARLRLAQAATYAAHTRGNFRLLLHGPPGNGKSSLARLVAIALGGLPDDGTREFTHGQTNGVLSHTNGRDVSIDRLRQWQWDVRLRPLLPPGATGRRCFWIDECDGLSPAALDYWRTFSDTLPPGIDVVLTTNQPLERLQPQLQSRCQASDCPPLEPAEVAAFLTERFAIPEFIARQIAAGSAAAGDARAALCDAETWLANQTLLAEAA